MPGLSLFALRLVINERKNSVYGVELVQSEKTEKIYD
jgi:hypothetical protein